MNKRAVVKCVLPEPTLGGYEFPDPCADLYFRDIPPQLARHGDCFRMYCIGFSIDAIYYGDGEK